MNRLAEKIKIQFKARGEYVVKANGANQCFAMYPREGLECLVIAMESASSVNSSLSPVAHPPPPAAAANCPESFPHPPPRSSRAAAAAPLRPCRRSGR